MVVDNGSGQRSKERPSGVRKVLLQWSLVILLTWFAWFCGQAVYALLSEPWPPFSESGHIVWVAVLGKVCHSAIKRLQFGDKQAFIAVWILPLVFVVSGNVPGLSELRFDAKAAMSSYVVVRQDIHAVEEGRIPELEGFNDAHHRSCPLADLKNASSWNEYFIFWQAADVEGYFLHDCIDAPNLLKAQSWDLGLSNSLIPPAIRALTHSPLYYAQLAIRSLIDVLTSFLPVQIIWFLLVHLQDRSARPLRHRPKETPVDPNFWWWDGELPGFLEPGSSEE